MKDTKDRGTGDMFGIKRGRGRPKTGSAKTGAERQAAYRAKQVLTPEQAGEILRALRTAENRQLRG